MLRYLALVVVVCACASGLSCPRECMCPASDQYEYECGPEGSGVALTAQLNSFVNFRCYSPNVSCESIPHVNLASGNLLKHLTLRGCPPDLLACVMRAVNATGLKVLHFREPSKELKAEDLQGLSVPMLLFYDAPHVHHIPSDALLALPTLRELRINDANLTLVADEFRGVDSIQFLELSADKIKTIPAGAFRGLKQLKQLQLWKNRIQDVSRGSFEGLDSVEEISLMGNLLTKLPVGVFEGVPKLKVLYLEENNLKRLTEGVFTGRHLENITISSNTVPLHIENRTFADLPALRHLDLAYSFISSLPSDLFRGSAHITHLILQNNRIEQLPDDLFKGLEALEELDLSFNSISSVSSNVFVPLKALVELNLERNRLQVLPDNLFAGLTNFTVLKVDHNLLHTISQMTFHGAGSLHTVSMVGNRLSLSTKDVTDYDSFYAQSPFWHLTDLRELYLRENEVEIIFYDWTVSMTQLTKLDLSWNNFTVLSDVELQFLSNKLTVDLSHNNISTISLRNLQAPHLQRGETYPVTILLEDNPINCDCELFGLSLALKGWRPEYSFPSFDLGKATCASPADKKGYLVKSITPDQITCDLPNATDCPSQCECSIRPFDKLMELDCQYLPNVWPNLNDSRTNSINLRLHNVNGLTTLPRTVQALNLSGLHLVRVPPFEATHLRKLDLRNTSLRELPMDILNTSTRVNLSSNPFQCDCWSKNEITAFVNSYNVDDYNNVTCRDGRKMTDLDLIGLCTVVNASVVAGSLFVLLIIISLSLAAVISRYRQEILVYVTDKGYLRWLIDVDYLDKDKIYDVFVSFSHQDEAFVINTLIPKLETDFMLKVCVHYRDWIVGDMIPIQINRSVEQSRRTLIVLSRSFLSSIWASVEFRTAHSMALREGIARVVLIIYEDDVLTDPKIDEELQAYLSTNTYLKLDDPKFWERLKKAVPRRERKFTFLRKWRQLGVEEVPGTEKTGKCGLDGQLRNGKLINAALEKDIV